MQSDEFASGFSAGSIPFREIRVLWFFGDPPQYLSEDWRSRNIVRFRLLFVAQCILWKTAGKMVDE